VGAGAAEVGSAINTPINRPAAAFAGVTIKRGVLFDEVLRLSQARRGMQRTTTARSSDLDDAVGLHFITHDVFGAGRFADRIDPDAQPVFVIASDELRFHLILGDVECRYIRQRPFQTVDDLNDHLAVPRPTRTGRSRYVYPFVRRPTIRRRADCRPQCRGRFAFSGKSRPRLDWKYRARITQVLDQIVRPSIAKRASSRHFLALFQDLGNHRVNYRETRTAIMNLFRSTLMPPFGIVPTNRMR
jgi:hypothetical protein